ncbi:MAG: hypothetical protein LBH25_01225 [Fibromonadaceae bacterium]|nr:hypothetical protein [Fibromonadaceae bacterium]
MAFTLWLRLAALLLLYEVSAQEACPVPVVRTPKEIDDFNQKSIKGTNPNFVLSIGKFTDARDNKTYKTTKIGAQTWMAQNLNYSAEGKCYGNLETNCTKYGRLYGWEAASVVCPSGWRLPKGEEWQALVDFVRPAIIWKEGMSDNYGRITGTKLKAKKGWDNNGNGTDNYEFSALPGGQGNSYGDFIGIGFDGTWWSQGYYGDDARGWNMYHNDGDVNGSSGESNLRSIRCVIDEQCNGKSYNPSTQKCSDDGKTVLTKCGRSDNYYDASTHFCYWRDDKIYEKCNYHHTYESYNVYDPKHQFCFRGKGYNRVYKLCGTQNGYNPSTHFCSDGSLKKYGEPFTDSRDKKTYKTVKIGTQTWMAENLNYRGTAADTIGKCFDNDTTICNMHGRLYNFAETKNACPKGWHLPSDKEWATLIKYAGDSLMAAVKLKSMDWSDIYFDAVGSVGKKSGTNDFGFTALPGGSIGLDGKFYSAHEGFWWSTTKNYWHLDSDDYYIWPENSTEPKFKMDIDTKFTAINSIRCIKD